jgi:hypothetical protein
MEAILFLTQQQQLEAVEAVHITEMALPEDLAGVEDETMEQVLAGLALQGRVMLAVALAAQLTLPEVEAVVQGK